MPDPASSPVRASSAALAPPRVFRVVIKAPVADVWREITRTDAPIKCFFNSRMHLSRGGLAPGSRMAMRSPDGRITGVVGEILEIVLLKKFSHTFRFTNMDDPPCVVTYELREVPEGTDIPALAERIAALPGVEYACPDRVTSISATPSDTRYSEQWGFPKIHADAAWDTETGDTDVLLAVLDTGISWASGALTHPDLDDTGRYLLGTDFIGDDTVPEDGFGHGTHVAGTCAAESNNAQGVSGMNWVSQVYVCKVFDDSGFGSESDFQAAAEEAVDYAVANSKRLVINLSARWTTDSPR